MKLEWSLLAVEDRGNIFDYIAQDNPRAAVDVDDRIETQIERLCQFPECGRPGRELYTRELVLHQLPYIVAYCLIGDNTILVLRILHSAQLWPDSLSELP